MSLINLTNENFDVEAVKSDKPVLIDFWAPWCAPCRALGPTIEELARECTDYKICKVNVDEQPELARRYQVSSIPTLLLFRSGKPVAKSVGYCEKERLIALLDAE